MEEALVPTEPYMETNSNHRAKLWLNLFFEDQVLEHDIKFLSTDWDWWTVLNSLSRCNVFSRYCSTLWCVHLFYTTYHLQTFFHWNHLLHVLFSHCFSQTILSPQCSMISCFIEYFFRKNLPLVPFTTDKYKLSSLPKWL